MVKVVGYFAFLLERKGKRLEASKFFI